MSESEEKQVAIYSDQVVSYVSLHFSSNENTLEKYGHIRTIIKKVSDFFYNSGYNDAMELNSLDQEKDSDGYEPKSFLEENQEEQDNETIFAPNLADISDSELIEELKSRGYTGHLVVNKKIEL